MPSRETYKGLDKIALYIIGENNINDTLGDRLSPIVQYWTAQSNTAVIFATVFSTLGLSLLLELKGILKLIAVPIFIIFIYFTIRTWAYGRCARIACSAWK